MPDLKRVQHLARGGEGPLHPNQHNRVVLTGILARDVVQPARAHRDALLAGGARNDALDYEALIVVLPALVFKPV